MQLKGCTGLQGTLQVAGSAKLQVGFGDAETVVGSNHDIHPFAGLFAQLEIGEEEAVALVSATSDASAELVELAEAKTLSVLDHHDGRVRYVHADLDDGRRDEYLRLAGSKTLHLQVFVSGFHLAVNHRDLIFGEGLAELIETVLQVLQVEFLILFDKRIDDVYLPSVLDLLAQEGVHLCAALDGVVDGLHGLTSRGKLVDDGDLEIAIDGHCQGAGDRCRGHDEDVGRTIRHRISVSGDAPGLAPKFCPLCYAEAVLLINHHKSQVLPLHVILQ